MSSATATQTVAYTIAPVSCDKLLKLTLSAPISTTHRSQHSQEPRPPFKVARYSMCDMSQYVIVTFGAR